ncbi:FHA domain-containing protein At4g14490-like isoform X2 [Phalaenopsis equestris]|uniref:FHA domain-containing protein At4g14490-like isoform X2 n=1 Tax=Phalaenopsis equestris TaxID=78828 RepID=UPI0009E475FA|nr:FHA domain-containing protein At4g14490-like isoform X2 [Phalaenopsis equestris]
MENPNLTLSIDEGPKKGETFDRRPGSFIRIGRVLRGNTVAIKDTGISQKHLIVEFNSEISRWTVTDLGASNGTTVNGAVIKPNDAFTLANGDVIKIGENTLISVKISVSSSLPEPRTKRGRRAAAAAVNLPVETEVKAEKATDPAKLREKGASQGKACTESSNVDDAVKRIPEERKRRMRTRASANSCGNATRAIELSARILKEKNEEREVRPEMVESPTKIGGRGISRQKSSVEPARVTKKDAALAPLAVEQKSGRNVKAFSVVSSDRVVAMKDEDGEASEKIKVLVNDGRRGRGRGKKSCGPSRVLSKDDALEPAVVEGRMGRVTRATTMAMNNSACFSKVYEGEAEGIKEKKLEEPANNRGKQRANGKRGGRSSRISRKGEILESVAIEGTLEGSMNRALDVVAASSTKVPKDLQKKKMMAAQDLNSVYLQEQEKKKSIVKKNSSGDGKKLSASIKVRFRIEEAENNRNIMMFGQSNKTKDLHSLGEANFSYSWSSFSEIRGIPNTTSKYRECRISW